MKPISAVPNSQMDAGTGTVLVSSTSLIWSPDPTPLVKPKASGFSLSGAL
jgi:hypothetical protein